MNVFYIPTDMHMTSVAVEQVYLDILKAVKKTVSLPIAVKIGPHFRAIGDMCSHFERGWGKLAGAVQSFLSTGY